MTHDDLVGQYIGHTAPKTKETLKRDMGGVLYVDEAYYLYRQENERDNGQEAIKILLQVMENQRDDLVAVLAGYKDRIVSAQRHSRRLKPTSRDEYTSHAMLMPAACAMRSTGRGCAKPTTSLPKGGRISKADLVTIEAEDILVSRVFSEETSGDKHQSNAEKTISVLGNPNVRAE